MTYLAFQLGFILRTGSRRIRNGGLARSNLVSKRRPDALSEGGGAGGEEAR